MPSPSCRCLALTRAGKQCGITSTSQLLDSSGHLAAAPLLRGGSRCAFHARWFCATPAATEDLVTPPLVVYIDLETTGLSLGSDEIVEIGALADGSLATFSTVVRPVALPADTGVHGISPAELLQGPAFPEAFDRMAEFLVRLAAAASTSEDSSSSDESWPEPPRLRSTPPRILLAAHNGLRFDFGFIMSMCWRSSMPRPALGDWLYVDTLDVLRATDASGACFKLQCQRISRGVLVEARAHRALDDCMALACANLRAQQGPADLAGSPCSQCRLASQKNNATFSIVAASLVLPPSPKASVYVLRRQRVWATFRPKRFPTLSTSGPYGRVASRAQACPLPPAAGNQELHRRLSGPPAADCLRAPPGTNDPGACLSSAAPATPRGLSAVRAPALDGGRRPGDGSAPGDVARQASGSGSAGA